jgi:hypothetical protein
MQFIVLRNITDFAHLDDRDDPDGLFDPFMLSGKVDGGCNLLG